MSVVRFMLSLSVCRITCKEEAEGATVQMGSYIKPHSWGEEGREGERERYYKVLILILDCY